MSLKSVVFLLALCLLTPFLAGEARGEKRITLLLWSEEPRYVNCRNGILEELKKGGYGDQGARFTVESADGSKAKLVRMVQEAAAAKPDLIITVSTTATLAAAKEIKDIPLVFSMVFDPVEAGIVETWERSGNNATGVSAPVLMTKVVAALQALKPVKRLAVLYTPGEKNSELQLLELQRIQKSAGVKVIPIIVSQDERIAAALEAVLATADAIFLTGSSVIGNAAPLITDLATQRKVPTVTNIYDLAEKGSLLTVCPNPYLVGRLTGKKAIKILQGARPASIPIESEKRLDIILNLKTARAGAFPISASFMKQVTRTIK